MKSIFRILPYWLLLISGSNEASTLHVPGALFKNLSGIPADVSESAGCYFEVQNAGFTLPADATVFSIEVSTSNLTSSDVNVNVFFSRHVGVDFPQSVLSESITVSPGYHTNVLPVQTGNGHISTDEFTVLSVWPSDDQVGICGLKIHYLDDLIYAGSFD
ncbi:hypothetical protein ACFODZ_10175 [Marinicella sediminis]|uniref:Uncharacterized protein n=1 Tax=Marinicella sediminis TaxID=1792834 RepID=A0ABV7JBV4_9GAMM|nr:hypothetical protein [Marinicella sediminis]